MKSRKTTASLNPSQVSRIWYVIDASKQSLGRTASAASKLLNGKHKPTYTPHVDGGDFVIVINTDQLITTGKKDSQKIYYRHSGYPGSIKQRTLNEYRDLDSTKVLFMAIRGMLAETKLRPDKLSRLKIYAGAEHGHEAQKPLNFEVK